MHELIGSYSHVTSFESRNGVDCNTTCVCKKNSMTIAASGTVNSVTMASSSLDARSQTGMPSMMCSIANLNAGNDVTSYFQMNLDFVYNIIMVASVFGSIVENARCQHALDIVILGQH